MATAEVHTGTVFDQDDAPLCERRAGQTMLTSHGRNATQLTQEAWAARMAYDARSGRENGHTLHAASWSSCRMQVADVQRAADLLRTASDPHLGGRAGDVLLLQKVPVDSEGLALGQESFRDQVVHTHAYGTLHLVTMFWQHMSTAWSLAIDGST